MQPVTTRTVNPRAIIAIACALVVCCWLQLAEATHELHLDEDAEACTLCLVADSMPGVPEPAQPVPSAPPHSTKVGTGFESITHASWPVFAPRAPPVFQPTI